MEVGGGGNFHFFYYLSPHKKKEAIAWRISLIISKFHLISYTNVRYLCILFYQKSCKTVTATGVLGYSEKGFPVIWDFNLKIECKLDNAVNLQFVQLPLLSCKKFTEIGEYVLHQFALLYSKGILCFWN